MAALLADGAIRQATGLGRQAVGEQRRVALLDDGVLRAAPALAAQLGQDLLGEEPVLLLDLLVRHARGLEAQVQAHVPAAVGVLAELEDALQDALLAALEDHVALAQQLGRDRDRRIERLARIAEHAGEPERRVEVPQRHLAVAGLLEVADAALLHVDHARGDQPAAPLAVPSRLELAAAEAVGPVVPGRLLHVDVDLLADLRRRLVEEVAVDAVARRPLARAVARDALPQRRIGLLDRLRQHRQLLEARRRRDHRHAARVQVRRPDVEDVLHGPGSPRAPSWAIVCEWFHFAHVGGTEKNSPWCENDCSVHAFLTMVNASSKKDRLRSWSWVVEPSDCPKTSVSRG